MSQNLDDLMEELDAHRRACETIEELVSQIYKKINVLNSFDSQKLIVRARAAGAGSDTLSYHLLRIDSRIPEFRKKMTDADDLVQIVRHHVASATEQVKNSIR